MRLVENGALDVTDNVAIFAHNFGQCDFANFCELCFRKSIGGCVVFVPEPIATFQLLKLNACKLKTTHFSLNSTWFWEESCGILRRILMLLGRILRDFGTILERFWDESWEIQRWILRDFETNLVRFRDESWEIQIWILRDSEKNLERFWEEFCRNLIEILQDFETNLDRI